MRGDHRPEKPQSDMTTHLGWLAARLDHEPVTDVDAGVFAELAGPQEALGTDAAAVRFVGHVALLVRSEVGDRGERLPTLQTAVRLVRHMALHVLFEFGGSGVALPTDGADVTLQCAAGSLDCK